MEIARERFYFSFLENSRTNARTDIAIPTTPIKRTNTVTSAIENCRDVSAPQPAKSVTTARLKSRLFFDSRGKKVSASAIGPPKRAEIKRTATTNASDSNVYTPKSDESTGAGPEAEVTIGSLWQIAPYPSGIHHRA